MNLRTKAAEDDAAAKTNNKMSETNRFKACPIKAILLSFFNLMSVFDQYVTDLTLLMK